MARVLILTDRSPEEADWKGALTWQIILNLAETQHEVLVATPLDLEEITLTHPRLTVTRPIESWRLEQMPKLARLLITYQPQILHTFATHPSRLWPKLSVWPYLDALCSMIPNLRRYSTVFEAEDLSKRDPSYPWHLNSERVTVFSEGSYAKIQQTLPDLRLETIPLEAEFEALETRIYGDAVGRVLIPAPVSDWPRPQESLSDIVDHLMASPDSEFKILGGWGNWTSAERKHGWQTLQAVAGRIAMTEPVSYSRLRQELASAGRLWLDPLDEHSWRFLICRHLAESRGTPVHRHSNQLTGQLDRGSLANTLSRLYSRN